MPHVGEGRHPAASEIQIVDNPANRATRNAWYLTNLASVQLSSRLVALH
jgi:hypothetical protein